MSDYLEFGTWKLQTTQERMAFENQQKKDIYTRIEAIWTNERVFGITATNQEKQFILRCSEEQKKIHQVRLNLFPNEEKEAKKRRRIQWKEQDTLKREKYLKRCREASQRLRDKKKKQKEEQRAQETSQGKEEEEK